MAEYPILELRALRDTHLTSEPPDLLLEVIDTRIEMVQQLKDVLQGKVFRLKVGMVLLVLAAALLTLSGWAGNG